MGTPARNTAYEVTDKKGERKTNTIGYRILGLILVILLAHNLAIAAYRGAMSTGWRGTDESQYYRAAKRLAVRQPLYSTTPTHLADTFVYPPYMAFIFRPMLSLGKFGSYRLWLGTIITLLMASCVITALYFAETQTAIWLLIPLFFVTGFRCWPSVIEFALGNVQMVLLFLTCLMCITAAKGRWKTFILLVAAAAMVKTWMVGFVMVPLFAKQYKMAIYAMVITMLLLCAAFFIVGWQQFPRFIETMRMYSVQPDLIALSASGIARQFFSTNKIIHPIFVSSIARIAVTAAFYCWIGFLALRLCPMLGPESYNQNNRVCYWYHFARHVPWLHFHYVMLFILFFSYPVSGRCLPWLNMLILDQETR